MGDANDGDAGSDDLAGGAAEPVATIPDYSSLPPARVPTPMGVVAVIAVKIAGLYCLIQALPFVYLIPADLILAFSGQGIGRVDVLVNLLHPTLNLVAGLVLVNRATWVATRVLGFDEPSDDPRPRAPGRRLQAIAFSVLGVWLVIDGLVEVVRLFVQARYAGMGNDVITSAFAEPSGLVATAAQLALGVWLFFGSKRLALFWSRLRNPNPVSQSEPPTDA